MAEPHLLSFFGLYTQQLLVFYPAFSFSLFSFSSVTAFSLVSSLPLLCSSISPSCSFPSGWCSILYSWRQCVPHHSLCFLLSAVLLSVAATHGREKGWGDSWCYQQVEISPLSSGAQCGQRRTRPEGSDMGTCNVNSEQCEPHCQLNTCLFIFPVMTQKWHKQCPHNTAGRGVSVSLGLFLSEHELCKLVVFSSPAQPCTPVLLMLFTPSHYQQQNLNAECCVWILHSFGSLQLAVCCLSLLLDVYYFVWTQ